MEGPFDIHDPNAAARLTRVLLPEDELMQEYYDFLAEDPGVEKEALDAAEEMRRTPIDDLDRKPLESAKRRIGAGGKVGRRAPPNPFHSPKLGRWRTGQKAAKVDDPALQNNPLRGRLIVMIGVNAALLLVFIQSLVYNFTELGSFYASQKENSNVGPEPQTLYDMGGLNANAIRSGQWIRLYWSMWMHSGWIHIALNLLCQLQYLYMLEPDWGTIRTLLLFWVSGMTGNLMSVVLDPCKTTVGSSGGLFGLMGGVVPYCIEFWHSIPRPLCILIFSIIVLIVSIATGLSKATDTWAHLGGLIGGLLFGFGTITTPAAFNSTDRPLKKQVRKNALMRWLQQTINPECKCGVREWAIRLSSWTMLTVTWVLCYLYLYKIYDYQPPGSLTYKGITKCCCCYDMSGDRTTMTRENWFCSDCDATMTGGTTWGSVCEAQKRATNLFASLDGAGTMNYTAIDEALSGLRGLSPSSYSSL